MAILYRALRRALRVGLSLYYVDIQATGRERIPSEGPVVFAANHPNSIMDSVVLGSQTDRTISYLARSGLFRNALVATLFRSCGVIPLYRRQDGPPSKGSNDESFRAAFDVLAGGGTIGIFPEGQNAPERHVRAIKTGTARIALGAEARNGFQLGVRVVPVGLNFEDRDRWLTRVLVRFGEPIDCRELRDRWEEDEREAVRELTDRIQEAIRTEAVHIEDERNHDLVKDVTNLYGGELMAEQLGDVAADRSLRKRLFDRMRGADASRSDLDDWFSAKQRIADAVKHFESSDPALLERMRKQVRRYKDHLKQASLRRDFLDRPPNTLSRRREAVKLTLYAVLLAPIALWGLIHNFIPSRITRRMALRAPDEAMRAFTVLLVGAVAFGLFYSAYGWLVYSGSGSVWGTTAYLVSLPFAGFWWVRYMRQLARYNDRIVARALFVTNKTLLRQLAVEREQLLMELDELRKRYVAERAGEA